MPEGKPIGYRVETLVIFVIGPFVVLALLSLLAVLVCRRLHHGRLERLHEMDAEQGAIDGLIASNVGDGTLAVRLGSLLPALQRELISFHPPFKLERTHLYETWGRFNMWMG